METFLGDCGFILTPSEKPFSFSLLQLFLASEDSMDRLGLFKSSKDFQNFCNLEICFWLTN